MNLTTLFEKIAGKQKQREQARANDFRGLVQAIVAGQEPDPDRVEAVLAASGQTLDDLRAAVELRHRRIALKATLDTAPKLEAERAKLREQIGKAQDLLDAAEKKFAETTNPLRWRLDQIQVELQQTWGCPQQLIETCPYLELVERLRQTERALTEAHAEQTRLTRELDARKQAIRQLREEAEKTSSREFQADYLQRAGFRAEAVTELEATLDAVRNRIVELDKQQEVIREQMMVP